jgi:hypothetical protein
MNLNLAGQQTIKTQVGPKLLQLKTALDLRLPVWNRLSLAKKRAWIRSNKDPVMDIAFDIYKYLDANFFGVDDEVRK